jgi:hypothetical protein
MAATHEKKPLRGSTRALSIRTLAQLIVKGTPHGNYDFLAQAWQAANDKAREFERPQCCNPLTGRSARLKMLIVLEGAHASYVSVFAGV